MPLHVTTHSWTISAEKVKPNMLQQQRPKSRFRENKAVYDSLSVESNTDDDEEDREEPHIPDYVKNLVYGGIDGIIATFATITIVFAADLPTSIGIVISLAHLFADGWSAGLSEVLISHAELEYDNIQRNVVS